MSLAGIAMDCRLNGKLKKGIEKKALIRIVFL